MKKENPQINEFDDCFERLWKAKAKTKILL